MTFATGVVRTVRGGVVESAHRVHAVVVGADGAVSACVGDPDRETFMRSAAKPFQALPLIDDGVADRFELSEEALAVCCASHNSEQRHLDLVASLLRDAGATEEDLECGPHPPLRTEVGEALARSGRVPTPLYSNCSGKHAGMLALAAAMGWDPVGYIEPEHPVQRRIRDEIVRWTGVPGSRLGEGRDGCGVVSFAVPLRAMAHAYARLGVAASGGEPGPARIVSAMANHPFLIAGTGRLCTDLTAWAKGSIVAKVGAEGVYCATLPGLGAGVALKIEDGARRATGPALIATLLKAGALTPADLDGVLAPHARPSIENTRGEVVGTMVVEMPWTTGP